MRDCGSLSNKSMGLSSKLDEIDTDMGSCFPIKVIVNSPTKSPSSMSIYT